LEPYGLSDVRAPVGGPIVNNKDLEGAALGAGHYTVQALSEVQLTVIDRDEHADGRHLGLEYPSSSSTPSSHSTHCIRSGRSEMQGPHMHAEADFAEVPAEVQGLRVTLDFNSATYDQMVHE
jgi:hypothetical protein